MHSRGSYGSGVNLHFTDLTEAFVHIMYNRSHGRREGLELEPRNGQCCSCDNWRRLIDQICGSIAGAASGTRRCAWCVMFPASSTNIKLIKRQRLASEQTNMLISIDTGVWEQFMCINEVKNRAKQLYSASFGMRSQPHAGLPDDPSRCSDLLICMVAVPLPAQGQEIGPQRGAKCAFSLNNPFNLSSIMWKWLGAVILLQFEGNFFELTGMRTAAKVCYAPKL
ncbi:hypothetical protein F2P81_016856 [Scophthalmus maximus]|uniref:Uncharacterized protein n=1 Tax=Scophthalmus maximus TaxID=52904 RepID=A0A6A4SCD7_SCOMX|nr:hypothetical protein F2P81_016856 [Scophthalmus maximus]